MFFLFVQVIVQYPPTKPLSSEEGDLIWKFRFYLSNQKKVKYIYLILTKCFVDTSTSEQFEITIYSFKAERVLFLQRITIKLVYFRL